MPFTAGRPGGRDEGAPSHFEPVAALSNNAISLVEARRIALAAQGFDRPRPKRVTIGHVRDAVRRVAALQLDFVNALVPAHQLVIFSRIGAWHPKVLDTLVSEHREFTEQTAHEASLVPVEMWPLLRERMASMDRRAARAVRRRSAGSDPRPWSLVCGRPSRA
jgi:uncharacterized protein YcaQ